MFVFCVFVCEAMAKPKSKTTGKPKGSPSRVSATVQVVPEPEPAVVVVSSDEVEAVSGLDGRNIPDGFDLDIMTEDSVTIPRIAESVVIERLVDEYRQLLLSASASALPVPSQVLVPVRGAVEVADGVAPMVVAPDAVAGVDDNRCIATTKAGNRCKQYCWSKCTSGDRKCYMHCKIDHKCGDVVPPTFPCGVRCSAVTKQNTPCKQYCWSSCCGVDGARLCYMHCKAKHKHG